MSPEPSADEFHLVVFSEQFYPDTSGGAHTRWLFSQRAVERGAEVTVFTMKDPGTPRSETVNGVRILRPISGTPSSIPVYNNLSLPFRIFSSALILLYAFWWFQRNQVDAIHSTSHSFHWVAKILALTQGVVLTNFMGYTPSVREETSLSLRWVLEQVNFRFFMGSTAFCRAPGVKKTLEAAGQNDARILHGILNREKISDVENSDPMDIRRNYGITKGDTLVVFVGRLVPIKQPVDAVDNFKYLSEDYKLLMVGDGPEKDRVRRKIETDGLTSQITLAGELSHQSALDVIKSSDILLLTSAAEAYPTVVFEGLALGSQVIAPPVGVLPSISHPDLHLSPIEEQKETLSRISGGEHTTQDDVADEYSIERYTDEILSASKL